MRAFLKAATLAGLIVASSSAGAQVQPIPEAQLNNGFLGDQNFRLTSQEPPTDAHFTIRAAAALASKDYSRALAILRPHRRTHTVAYHFLAGQAHQGLGDVESSRREYVEANRLDRSFVGGQLALGLLEAEHGDKAAAQAILAKLAERRDRCAGECADASKLTKAVELLESALRTREG